MAKTGTSKTIFITIASVLLANKEAFFHTFHLSVSAEIEWVCVRSLNWSLILYGRSSVQRCCLLISVCSVDGILGSFLSSSGEGIAVCSLPFHRWEGRRRQESQAGGILALPCAMWPGGKSPYLWACMQTGKNVSNLPSSTVGNGWKHSAQGEYRSWPLFFKMCSINMWWMNE